MKKLNEKEIMKSKLDSMRNADVYKHPERKIPTKWKWITALFIILAVIVISISSAGSWVIKYNNDATTMNEDIKTQFSNIKTEYQRRYDLYLPMAEVIKSFSQHEHDTLMDTIRVRNMRFSGNGNDEEDLQVMNNMDVFFMRMAGLVEQYPEIKSMPMYQDFNSKISGTEDRINVARTDYNGVVRNYNIYINTFPNVLLKGLFKQEDKEYFENKPVSDDLPEFDLSYKKASGDVI